MAYITASGFAHLRLTVTDIARSKAFYDDVFGWTVLIDNSANVGAPGVTDSPEAYYGGVVYDLPDHTRLGLRPVAPADQRFDSEHAGLDHLSFRVESRAELEKAVEHFDAAGIEHGEITELDGAGIAILAFSDPDGIHLELTATL